MTTEYFQIAHTSECAESCVYYGWNIEKNELGGLEPGGPSVEIYRNVLRLITLTKIYNITLVGQLNSRYGDYTGVPITVSFNGADSFNLYSGDTYSPWMLDSEEIIATSPKGTGISSLRQEYKAYGQWRYIDWTEVTDVASTPTIITSDSVSGDWFDLISYKTSGLSSTMDSSSIYLLNTPPTTYSYNVKEKYTRSKLMQVQMSQIHDSISGIISPKGCAISTMLEGVFNSTDASDQRVISKLILPISDVAIPIGGKKDQDRAFRLMSQSIEPYDKDGGKLCILSSVYQCVGADIDANIKISNPWVPRVPTV